MADFSSEGTDFSGLYTDPSAPKDANPSDELFKQLAAANAPAPIATTPTGTPTPVPNPAAAQAPAPAAAPAAAPAPAANPSSVNNVAIDQAALLARLAPLGIKSMAELKGKSDVELRKISSDAIGHEQRQRDLTKHFKRNVDGSWDFSMGPDGKPTGLDPMGKVLPPAGTVVVDPAAPKPAGETSAPAAKAKASSKKPAAKKPAAKKPAAKRPVVTRKPTTRKPTTKKPTTKKPVARTRVTAKPAARTTLRRAL